MHKLKKESYKTIVDLLDKTKEFIIDLPTTGVKDFKTRVSQMRHYLGHEGRCSYKTISEKDGITSLHITVGGGKALDFEHYGIREVEDL